MPAIKQWKPVSAQQEAFLALPETIKEGFFGGSAGPGKSECLMMYPIVRGYINHSRFKGLFMRRTFPELKHEIIPRTRDLYTAFGGKYNKSDSVWEFPSGALIFFGHCENENDVSKYDSMEINLFMPDELESFLEWQYIYIGFTRVRTSFEGLPAIIRAAGMPGGIGHTWVKKRFIDPAPLGGKVIVGKGGNKRIFISSLLAHNPKISKEYAQSLEMLPEAEKRAKKFGDWSSFEGQVFDEFRDKNYPDEPPNALHVVPASSVPILDYYPKISIIDWGFAPPAMTYVGTAAITPWKQIVFYNEQHWQKTPIEMWGAELKPYLDNTANLKILKICKSAGQKRGQEHTILQQVSDALGRTLEETDNKPGSRVAGKLLLHEYLRWKPKQSSPISAGKYDHTFAEWLLRNKPIEIYAAYQKQFAPVDDNEKLPKLLITDNCTLLISAIKACIYDKTNPQDVAEFAGDDPYDVIRYIVDAADRYFDEATSEFQKLETQQQIMDALKSGAIDMTMYYRNMAKIENDENQIAVKRYHHAH